MAIKLKKKKNPVNLDYSSNPLQIAKSWRGEFSHQNTRSPLVVLKCNIKTTTTLEIFKWLWSNQEIGLAVSVSTCYVELLWRQMLEEQLRQELGASIQGKLHVLEVLWVWLYSNFFMVDLTSWARP